jgi:poly-gamma-glutamate system protein
MSGTRRPSRGSDAALLAFAATVSLALAVLAVSAPASDPGELEAAQAMRQAMAAVRDELTARGITLDSENDPEGSGLVGLPWSGLTTTLGSLPAKRSAAQPASAALLRRLYREAGARPGDAIAIDSSGSFPGFALAAAIAAEGLGAKTIIIVSIGSSTWGANRPDFALPDMLAALVRRGIVGHGADAVSAGGAGDSGSDMDPEALAATLARARASGAVIIESGSPAADLAARQALIAERAGGTRLAAFVSIGGNLPATGAGDVMAGLSGLIRPGYLPAGAGRGDGMVQRYLAAGVPVIRLIDVKELCARTGLAFDPRPWPADPGLPPPRRTWVGPFAIAALIVALAVALVAKRKAR